MPKHLTYIAFVLFLFLSIGCSSTISSKTEVPSSTAPAGDKAYVTNVIDGDTIDVDWQGKNLRVRYIGVDTPERDEPYYLEATQYNSQLVRGKEVIMVRDVSETDQYGRLLRYIYLPDGTFINAELIRAGYGRIVTFPPDVTQADYFAQLQREARDNQRGLWGLSELQALPAGCDTCGKNTYDCRDFDTQSMAQACYETCLAMTGEDIHHLDGGGDGVVCESLP